MSSTPTPQTSDQIYLNSPLYVNQNVNSYGSYFVETGYDYTFLVNLALMGDGNQPNATNITSIFQNASFIQDQNDAENVTINLTLFNSSTFVNWGTAINNHKMVTLAAGASTLGFSTLNPTATQTVGDRLLEVVAHKLFGNGQARAAIDNDLEFYTHDAVIWDHLSTALGTQALANDVFNQYVASGRYESEATASASANSVNGNDNNRFVNFNFMNLTFDYPMFLIGSLGLNSSMTPSEASMLSNGPVVGGTQMNNGLYNIPILIRFFA
jgi:hypothetical protein